VNSEYKQTNYMDQRDDVTNGRNGTRKSMIYTVQILSGYDFDRGNKKCEENFGWEPFLERTT